MITPAQHAEIRRLYYAEHWRVGTIAAQLGVHHETVAAAFNRASVLTQAGRCRATALDPYLAFVRDTLVRHGRQAGKPHFDHRAFTQGRRAVAVNETPAHAQAHDREWHVKPDRYVQMVDITFSAPGGMLPVGG